MGKGSIARLCRDDPQRIEVKRQQYDRYLRNVDLGLRNKSLVDLSTNHRLVTIRQGARNLELSIETPVSAFESIRSLARNISSSGGA